MPSHPLDPLSMEEIQQACALLKKELSLEHHHQFAYVVLEEPSQSDILNAEKEQTLDRIAFVCVLDSKTNQTYEGNVNLTKEQITRWELLPFDKPPYGQVPILPSDYPKCERIVKSDMAWREAMKKRGLSDSEIELIQIDPFAPGYFDKEDEKGKRLVRAVSYYREKLTDNAYARPIEGVIAVVDLVNECILRLDDDGLNTPIPKTIINYDSASIQEFREGPKPLDITQAEGPSFKVNGWEVEWQQWRFRVGFTPREGLVLHAVNYQDHDQERPILYRASIVDMVVPYADPSISHYFKSAFDSGENGFGRFANQLELGCDCLGQIYYFDVPIATEHGEAKLLKHAVCMHEEDAGILWKHYETRTGIYETRRARQLVVSFFTTIDNYDYGFYWRFGQDGSLKLEAKLTGIVQTAAIIPGTSYSWGSKLTHEIAGPSHQHLFSARLHMMVDGVNNSVSESEFTSLPVSADNPDGVGFGTSQTLLETESEGARDTNAATQRTWKIFNPTMINHVGEPTAYKLELPQTPLLLAHPSSCIYQRAGYATHGLWVTQYNPREKYASGDYPNQHAGGDGVSKYVQQNRPIINKPIVLWATFGATHLPRPEDFPVMPTATVMFELKPFGFFNHNPALGLPAERNKKSKKQNEKESELESQSCCSSSSSSMVFSLFNKERPTSSEPEPSQPEKPLPMGLCK
ncbi:primary-amine oxidase [Legionella bononiensis]|uniref:Amine oxidase n=1 Tax=Legionella bononiensis TaxID=2793102 RepID=A0ABS1W9C8_9GAMM|nr:primary-amine oxidase [Legionella bononiensis]MBL7480868.1 primary-amine oxidase [Legionella bononiensis]MBL7525950.1 primary-amine oxidase [Legionella bononiensis]MBL7563983.1 primary-amine oxidase [Legionella bononiensis]